MTANSKHNRYVATPDWFSQSNSPMEIAKPIATSQATMQTITMSGSSGSGVTEVILYNKFVLVEFSLDSKILTLLNTALIVESADNNTGDLVTVENWAVSDYIPVAANTQLTVNASVHEHYGIVFYDETYKVIRGNTIESIPQTITTPKNSTYFRICSEVSFTEFSITGFKSKSYEYDQIDVSDQNVDNFLSINETIPEGIRVVQFDNSSLQLLVQDPLSLHKDKNDVVKLSLDYNKLINDVDNMFVWDKTLSAYGYDAVTNTAYSYIDGEQQFVTDGEGNQIPVMTDNQALWQYDPELSDKWIIKSTKSRVSLFGGLFEYDTLLDCFYFHKSIITSGGVVMYADDKTVDIPTIYEGLPIDSQTIYWEEIKNEDGTIIKTLKAKGKGGTLAQRTISGIGNALTDVNIVDDGATLSFVKGETFTKQNDFITLKSRLDDFLEGGANANNIIDKWKELEAFLEGLTESDNLANILLTKADKQYVDDTFLNRLTGGTMEGPIWSQLIAPVTSDTYELGQDGHRWLNIYSKEINVAGISVESKQNDVLYIDANLAVRGNITMYAYDPIDVHSWMKDIATDGITIINDDGILKINPEWDLSEQVDDLKYWVTAQIDSIQNNIISNNTELKEWVGDYYLPLIGGTITGSLIITKDNSTYGGELLFGSDGDVYLKELIDNQIIIHASNGIKLNPENSCVYINNIAISQSQNDVLYIDANVAIRGSITMYAYDSVDIHSWMEDIATDGNTIINDNGVLKLNPDFDLSEQVNDLEDTLKAQINLKWTQDNIKINHWDEAYSWGDHAEMGYATEEWVNMYYLPLTGGELTGSLTITKDGGNDGGLLKFGDGEYVYLKEVIDDQLTIYASKGIILNTSNNANGIMIDTIQLKRSTDDVLYIDANLVVRGGITMYGTDSTDAPDLSEFLDPAGYNKKGIASFDSTYFTISNGHVSLVADSVGLNESKLNQYLVNNSYITENDVNGVYLKLSGGTMTGSITLSDGYGILDDNGYGVVGVYPSNWDGISKDAICFGHTAAITYIRSKSEVIIYRSGNEYTVLDAGNYSSYLPLLNSNSSHATNNSIIYAPTSVGSNNQILKSNGSGAPSWINQSVLSVGSASTLSTTRTLWGQSFNGSGNVSGSLNSVDNINANYWSITEVNSSRVQISLPGHYVQTGNDGALYLGPDSSKGLKIDSGGVVTALSQLAFARDTSGTKGGHIQYENTYHMHIANTSGNGSIYFDTNSSSSVSAAMWLTHNADLYFRKGTNNRQLIISGKSATLYFQVAPSNGWTMGSYYRSGSTVLGGIAAYGSGSTLSYYFIGSNYRSPLIKIDTSGNLLSSGGITMYSDERKKTKLKDVELTLNQIANAPLIEHYYNSDEKKITHVSSVAQYWVGINDWFCKLDDSGYYTMEIQNLALASAISVARALQRFESDTDRQIRELKNKVERLEKELNEYKNK